MSEVLNFSININGVDKVLKSQRDIKNEIKALKSEIQGLDFGTQEYKNASKSIGELEGALKLVAKNQREVNKAFSTSINAEGYYNELNSTLNDLIRTYKTLTKEQLNSKEGFDLRDRIRKVDTELKGLDAGIGRYTRNVGDYKKALITIGDVVSGGLLTGGIENLIQGSITLFKSGLNLATEYEKGLDELQAITGVTADELVGFEAAAREISNIDFGGANISNSTTDILNAFKLVGSAKPELLGSADALKEVTKQAIILSKASGDSLEASVSALTSTLGQFGLAGSESGRIINELAAGSQVGAVEVPALTRSLQQFGATAAGLNVDTTESIALIETLGTFKVPEEQIGTSLRNILTTLAAPRALSKEAQDILVQNGVNLSILEDKNTSLINKLREFAKIQDDSTALVKVFGKESLNAGQVLLKNISTFEEYTRAIKGTDTANEQAAINSDNLASRIEELRNTFNDYLKDLFANGSPVFSFVVQALTGLILLFKDVSSVVTTASNIFGGFFKGIRESINGTDTYRSSLKSLVSAKEELITQYKSEVDFLNIRLSILKDNEVSTATKSAAIKELISTYGQYLGDLDTEAEILNNLDEVQRRVTNGILDRLSAKIKEATVERELNRILSVRLKEEEEVARVQSGNLTVYERASTVFLTSEKQKQALISNIRKSSNEDVNGITKNLERLPAVLGNTVNDLKKKVNLSGLDNSLTASFDTQEKELIKRLEFQRGIVARSNGEVKKRAIAEEQKLAAELRGLQDRRTKELDSFYKTKTQKEVSNIKKANTTVVSETKKGNDAIINDEKRRVDEVAKIRESEINSSEKFITDLGAKEQSIRSNISNRVISLIKDDNERRKAELKAGYESDVNQLQSELASIKTLKEQRIKELNTSIKELQGIADDSTGSARTDALNLIREYEAQKVQIETAFANSSVELEKSTNSLLLGIREKYHSDLKAVNERAVTERANKLVEDAEREIKAETERQNKLLEIQRNKDIQAANQSLKGDALENRLSEIDFNFNKSVAENALKELGVIRESYIQVFEVAKATAAVATGFGGTSPVSPELLKSLQDRIDKLTLEIDLAQSKIDASPQTPSDTGTGVDSDSRRDEVNTEIKNKSIQLAQEAANAIFEIEKANIERIRDERLNALDKEYETKKRLAEGDIVEEERLERELAKKKQEIDRQAAIERRRNARNEIIINSLIALTSALSSPLFPIQAAFIALQTAIALSRLDKLATGGWADGKNGNHAPDETGEVPTAIAHKGEYVARRKDAKSKEGRAIIEGYFENKRKGKAIDYGSLLSVIPYSEIMKVAGSSIGRPQNNINVIVKGNDAVNLDATLLGNIIGAKVGESYIMAAKEVSKENRKIAIMTRNSTI